MDKDLDEIIKILKKVLPQLLTKPYMIRGCDVSEEELHRITQTQTLSLKVLEFLAGDTFFETYFDEMEITELEAKEVSKFLRKTARYFLEDLQEVFPYLKK